MAQRDVVPLFAPAKLLPLRVRTATRLSDDELFELCVCNRGLRVERTASGELVIMSPTGGETGKRNFRLIVQLGTWAAQDGSGIGFDSSTGFILPNGAERAPDAAWLRRDRWTSLSAADRRKFVPLCPDFVVELRSPSDDLAELQSKIQEYVDCGALLGWLLDVDARHVWIYRPGHAPVFAENANRVSGDPELPGFVLRVDDLDA
jgi:Uma2 family endonuclease